MRWEAAPYKRNVSIRPGPQETIIEPMQILDDLLVDDYCEYMKKITHVHFLQLFLLADFLKDLILRPRENNLSLTVGHTPKHDHHHHHHQLFFVLKWLNDGTFHPTREAKPEWNNFCCNVI